MSDPIRGRWTLTATLRRGLEGAPMVLRGPRIDLYTSVEVVPVPDEQAIERAARALCEADTSDWDDCAFKDFHRNDARKALAAALEQPE